MLNNIQLGRYYPGDSFLHLMDTRVKIVLLILYLALVFAIKDWLAYGILTASVFSLIIVSRTSLKMMLSSLKPILWLIIFMMVVHFVSTPGEILWKKYIIIVTVEGVERGLYYSLRLVLLILISTLLTFTTSPLKLTDAIEALLSPLKKIGVPVHEFALMVTIALRFIPTLIEETDKIMKAQMSRGADFRTGNILTRLKALIPIMVPLFLAAFRRADELALAMEARCYHGGEGRTQLKKLSVTGIDYAAVAGFILLTTVVISREFNLW